MSVRSFSIEDVVNDLLKATETDDEKTAMRNTIILIGGAARDLNRIAAASERQAAAQEKQAEALEAIAYF